MQTILIELTNLALGTYRRKQYVSKAGKLGELGSKPAYSMKYPTVHIKTYIEASKGFPKNTRAFYLIYDAILEYLPLNEIVRSLS